MDEGSALMNHTLDNAQHMRLLTMGVMLLLVMRSSPGGILPETVRYPEPDVQPPDLKNTKKKTG
jgi:hypothetical protein